VGWQHGPVRELAAWSGLGGVSGVPAGCGGADLGRGGLIVLNFFEREMGQKIPCFNNTFSFFVLR
jgi:hypothetical protein